MMRMLAQKNAHERLAMFLVAGTVGPVGAMVANLTPLAIHGSAFATLTLANNLIDFTNIFYVEGHFIFDFLESRASSVLWGHS